MCYACNPSCGLCKPKRVISVTCPVCGAPSSLRREEYLLAFKLPHRLSILEKKIQEKGGVAEPVCQGCGTNLANCFREAVEPKPCLKQGIVCGYPCGRHGETPDVSKSAPCPFQVPLSKI